MGALSINKGKRAERDVARVLNPILQRVCQSAGIALWKLERNLVQAARGGEDLVGVDWIAIEIKHHNETNGKVVGWWAQAVRQAGTTMEPVLIYRANGTKWRVRLWSLLTIDRDAKRRLKVCSDISFEDFLLWFEKRCEVEAAKKKSVGFSFPVASGLFD